MTTGRTLVEDVASWAEISAAAQLLLETCVIGPRVNVPYGGSLGGVGM